MVDLDITANYVYRLVNFQPALSSKLQCMTPVRIWKWTVPFHWTHFLWASLLDAGRRVGQRKGSESHQKSPRHEAGSCRGTCLFWLLFFCFFFNKWRTDINSPGKLWKTSLHDSVNKSAHNINNFFIPWEDQKSEYDAKEKALSLSARSF